jgi:hypothetical protein
VATAGFDRGATLPPPPPPSHPGPRPSTEAIRAFPHDTVGASTSSLQFKFKWLVLDSSTPAGARRARAAQRRTWDRRTACGTRAPVRRRRTLCSHAPAGLRRRLPAPSPVRNVACSHRRLAPAAASRHPSASLGGLDGETASDRAGRRRHCQARAALCLSRSENCPLSSHRRRLPVTRCLHARGERAGGLSPPCPPRCRLRHSSSPAAAWSFWPVCVVDYWSDKTWL